jgi:hypothetical protein
MKIKPFKIFRNIFRYLLLIISVVLTIYSIIAIISIIRDASSLEWSFNKNGMAYFFNLFQPFQVLLASTFIVIPAYIGLETLISKLHYQEGEALLNLRKLLNEPENSEIHKKLRGESGDWAKEIPKEVKNNKDTWRKVDNYLGILELMNILINKGVLSEKNFKNQFGYRVKNVWENKDITEYINLYKDEAWKDLMCLFRKMGFKTTKYKNS